MKTIWIINHYATNQFIDHGGRHYCFAKYLIRAGYDVKIFCASTIHNTDKNVITDSRTYYADDCDGISFVFVKCRNYVGNGKSRILNMFDFYRNILKITSDFEKPDVVIGSSVHPLACVAAIKLGKRYKCKAITEIRDLWPESIVAYGLKKKNNPVIKLLYRLEKWIYTKADAIIFTMEGGRDYIIEKGWDKEHGGPVNWEKIYHINNGVDLEAFDYNREHFTVSDPDLDDPDTFKVVYAGSVRNVNNVGQLIDMANYLNKDSTSHIKLLIYGDGDERESLERRCKELNSRNIVFKGKISKEKIPFVLSRCDLSLLHWNPTPIAAYGMSMNKLFEYLASGNPVLSNCKPGYDIINRYSCGLSLNLITPELYAAAIIQIVNMPDEEYASYCTIAQKVAKKYDFKTLSEKLIKIIENIS